MPYDFTAIERRWQAHWDERETFRATIDPSKPKYYVLDMFPYPSGDGLHVGHAEGYTATDILARYKRMRGFAVLHPMGWDAFGLPAERYAIKTGTHPATRTAECVANFRAQQKRLGFSYDWAREIDTTDPKYYRWTQWIFLQLWGRWYDHEQDVARPIAELPLPSEVVQGGDEAIAQYRDRHRLAYLHEAPVNWCPELRIVLANEEVAEHVDAGREVVRRPMRQWMLRITEYAERLLTDLDGLQWSKSVLEMQRNWIGRSEGADVDFRVEGTVGADGEPASLTVFTTRPDTLYGATYMVVAPEHPIVAEITTDTQRDAVEAYIDTTSRRSERERLAESAEGKKTGVFTGAYATNPVDDRRVPIWISDYVLMGYGTGAIMAVPGHDSRDHAFAKAMSLPIVEVVAGGNVPIEQEAYCEPGVAVNSPVVDGLSTAEAKAKMIEHLEASGCGRRRVTYKLRDWLFSRQRYWGEPFPLLHRPNGEVVAVPDADLPVELPPVDDFNPSESGEPPLAKAEAWRRLPDGSLRETNTMPQWAGSCWYYLRFLDPHNEDAPFSAEAERYWMPVDLYVGGAEHAVLHLLYARFWHKVLFDAGLVSTREPFARLFNQGMVLGATYHPVDRRRDADGKLVTFLPDQVEPAEPGSDRWVHKDSREPVEVHWDKMSKSRGNVTNPDDVIRDYGADTLRLYEMFMGPLEHSAPWQPDGVSGCFKFLQRVHRLFFADDGQPRPLEAGEGTDRQRRLLHQTVAAVTDRLERMSFNTAISAMMTLVRDLVTPKEPLGRDAGAKLCLVLAPFAPHLAEEIWCEALGQRESLAYEPWPRADPAYLQDEHWVVVLQVRGKRRGELRIPQHVDAKDRDQVLALVQADEAWERYVGEQVPKRVIYVPGKLVNVVP
ncbi:MAG: leucine--tRNA ligase [Myxococcales bacterium FL481]|nr:MAG: leucine--tRNA ligase [Myxococcales bacterium FL481]